METNLSPPSDSELDLDYVIAVLYGLTEAHDRFPYFVDVIVGLLDHMCPGSDPEWEKYSRLICEAHNAGISATNGRLLYQEMLYVSAHHEFSSACVEWKFRSLNILVRPEDHVRLDSYEWLEFIDNTLSFMKERSDGEAAMREFIVAKIHNLAGDIGIDAAEWLVAPRPRMITDEMVDAWIDSNPDVQRRLSDFGL